MEKLDKEARKKLKKEAMEKLSKLKTDSIIIGWFDNINATGNTSRSYWQAMRQYTEHTKLSPEELLTEAETEGSLPPRQRKLKSRLISFRKSLTEKKASDKTIESRMGAIRSFYESYDIPVPKLKGERRAVTKDCNDIVPTKEDIQECLKVCEPLEKALILTGVSSGLASNEIRSLKLKQFYDGYDPETGITTLHVMREKTRVKFTTFLSPECSAAIRDYLEFRDRDLKAEGEGEKRQNQITKQKTTPNSYLFVLRGVRNAYLKTGNEELRKLSENAMIKIYRSISTKARKNTQTGTYNSVRSHTMRKYFSSALIAAGCDHEVKEYFMGHTLSQEAYFKLSTDKLKEIYMKFVPFLTIQKELDVSESPEYKKLLEDNKTLFVETERYRVERQELQDLREKLIETQMKLDTLAAAQYAEEEEENIRNEFEELRSGTWHIDTAQAEKIMEKEDEKALRAYEEMKVKRKGR